MKTCWMHRTVEEHRPTIVVRRYAAIGDCLAASIVADKLHERGYRVVWESHSSTHCILRRQPSIAEVREPNGQGCQINLDSCYERNPQRRDKHFSQLFLEKANTDLAASGISLGNPFNCRPSLDLHPVERKAARAKFEQYPKPWVFVCPFSKAWKNRTVSNYIWEAAAAKMYGTKFWMGYQSPAPSGFVDLNCLHLDNLVVWLSAADLLVTVDTGPMHIGAALGVPILALGQASSPERHLSDQRDFVTIYPDGNLRCLNCQSNLCTIPNHEHEPPCQKFNPDHIANWTNAKLEQVTTEKVSAIIPVYGSAPDVIKRCLECVLPQVDEIIITAETPDKMPPFPAHPKIRAVIKGIGHIGMGRNVNYGVRHSTGKYLLIMNDDVFLEPNAVNEMLKVMKPGVGCVSARLMYPDSTVYFAGKVRTPGQRGWAHMNLRQKHWDWKTPTEMENGFCACSLLTREAFYKCGCFDERYRVYCEDDAISLQLRRAGYKLMFAPDACGTHLEHQSTHKLGNIMDLVKQANRTFGEVWGGYFDHNINNSFGDFNY